MVVIERYSITEISAETAPGIYNMQNIYKNKGRRQMGQPDLASNSLTAHADVFADIINAIIYGGKTVLEANRSEEHTSELQSQR